MLKTFSRLLILCFSIGLSVAKAQQTMPNEMPYKQLIGHPFPDFSFQTMDGKKINLKALNCKVTVLNFWFIACHPCIAEMPMLNSLVEQYKNNPDVVFLSFAIDTRDEIKKFLASTRFSYQVIPGAYDFDKQLEISAFPTQLVLDRNGIVVNSAIGGYPEHTRSLLTESIEKALK